MRIAILSRSPAQARGHEARMLSENNDALIPAVPRVARDEARGE